MTTHNQASIPQRIFSTGSPEQIPRFDPVAQLCAASNRTGWATTSAQVPPQLKSKAKELNEAARKLVFDSMGTKVWTVSELREHVNSTNGTSMKRDTIRAHLEALTVQRVVKKCVGSAHKYWRV